MQKPRDHTARYSAQEGCTQLLDRMVIAYLADALSRSLHPPGRRLDVVCEYDSSGHMTNGLVSLSNESLFCKNLPFARIVLSRNTRIEGGGPEARCWSIQTFQHPPLEASEASRVLLQTVFTILDISSPSDGMSDDGRRSASTSLTETLAEHAVARWLTTHPEDRGEWEEVLLLARTERAQDILFAGRAAAFSFYDVICCPNPSCAASPPLPSEVTLRVCPTGTSSLTFRLLYPHL